MILQIPRKIKVYEAMYTRPWMFEFFFFFFFWMNILERVVSDIFTGIIYTKMDVEDNVNSLVPNTPRI